MFYEKRGKILELKLENGAKYIKNNCKNGAK